MDEGLVLCGKSDGALGIHLGVGDGCCADDFGISVKRPLLPLLLLVFKDGIQKKFAAPDLEPHGRWTAQMLKASTAQSCTLGAGLLEKSLPRSTDGLDELGLIGFLL